MNVIRVYQVEQSPGVSVIVLSVVSDGGAAWLSPSSLAAHAAEEQPVNYDGSSAVQLGGSVLLPDIG